MAKILVADDNQTSRYALEKFLSASGYNVVSAGNGQEAVEKFKSNKPDLVIMDLQMPIMDGFEAALQIRRDKNPFQIPIIFTSATYKDLATRTKALELGGNDYLELPIEPEELTAKVKAMLRVKQVHDDLLIAHDHLKKEIKERRSAEERLEELNLELEERIKERTEELIAANKQLKRENEERRRAEGALRYRVEFERLITALSTKFIKLATGEIDEGINDALHEIGQFAGVDRSYVFLFYDNLTRFDNTHEWCAVGIEPHIENNQGFMMKDFPWCQERITKLETIHIPRVADLPPEAIEKEVFQSQQIQSLILVPMVYGESLYGFLGLDSVRAEKAWSEEIVALLRIAGEIFANALERKRTEEALRQSEKKYSTLVESSLIGICIIEDGKIDFANKRFAEMHGYSLDELRGVESSSLVHPDDRALVEEIRTRRLKGEWAPSEYEARGLRKDGETIWTTRRFSLIEYKGRRAILGNVADITQRKWMQEALQESERDLRLLSSHLLTAEENERQRIAQELHDGIGQSLSAIKFSLEGILQTTAQETAVAGVNALRAVIPIIQEAIEEVRRIVMNLRPSTLDDLGILATIAWFSREFETVYSGIRIQKEIDIKEEEVPDHLKQVIYRVLQEALNNVAKHSRADFVRICLRKTDGTIELDIEDNGRGFDPKQACAVDGSKTGFGLLSMRERIQLSGGIHSVRSVGGAGTLVRASWLAET